MKTVSLAGTVVWLASVAAIILLTIRTTSAADLPLVSWNGETMGSVYTVKIVGFQKDDETIGLLKTQVDNVLKEVNHQMSHYQPDSELSGFNKAPAMAPYKVSAKFARVVRMALHLNQLSDGAFDPTIAPLVNLWGFGEKGAVHRIPDDEQLREAKKQCGCSHLKVTAADELIKDIPGLQLNLSAIAKGFGVDEMARVLREHGATNFYVSISGEIITMGHNSKGQPWQVGVALPMSNWGQGDGVAGVLSVSGNAVSTSGDYQRFVFESGRRFSHIIDPKSGAPVQHNLGSVSVVAESCAMADALSTAAFVLGPEKGRQLVESIKSASALFIIRDAEQSYRQLLTSRFTAQTGYEVKGD